MLKLQSAMEYLMTYGWAILIIAIVVVALFALGVFNSTNFVPRATAGACQVVRNIEGISLQGQCNNAIPRYVALFNGYSSIIRTPTTFPSATTQENFSVSAWININGRCIQNSFYCGIIDADNGSAGWGLMAGPGAIDFWIRQTNSTVQDMKFKVNTNTWYNVVVTYRHSAGSYVANGYVDGAAVANNIVRSAVTLPMPYPLDIGMARGQGSMVFNGSISNIQLYNTSLSNSSVHSLYLEGIGGSPIDVPRLVAWWPLNGNTNDYSGNGYNGNSANDISYINSWTSGYSQP